MVGKDRSNLLIHMGGLGDVCLSESTFYSISCQFQSRILALGVKRYLELFDSYFDSTDDIGSSRYLFLFSKKELEPSFENVILIGKDRKGLLRERLARLARGDLIFIDMYPEHERIHVEDYQLRQLERYGIKPEKKEKILKPHPNVIFYPERQIGKRKWDYENYVLLKERLEARGIRPFILGHEKIEVFEEDQIVIEDLFQMKGFLEEKGGIFISSDGGCAHLACACGLFTITLFFETDPVIWHPRRNNVFLTPKGDVISVDEVERVLLEVFFSFFRVP